MSRLQIKGANLAPRRDSFDPIETASRDEIGALQLERLKWTLNHAYSKVAHYKKGFDKAGIHPDDLKSLDDLRRFPFTEKADLRRNYPYGLFAVPLRDIVRIQSSPGTTNRPLVVGYTSQDVKLWLELLARLYTADGITSLQMDIKIAGITREIFEAALQMLQAYNTIANGGRYVAPRLVDAGLKAMATEKGPPMILKGAVEGATTRFMGDEHLAVIATRISLGAHGVVVLDGAGWHTSKGLVVPSNITLITQPPFAPELNPVENVWAYLRSNKLSNRVFETYEAIIDAGRKLT